MISLFSEIFRLRTFSLNSRSLLTPRSSGTTSMLEQTISTDQSSARASIEENPILLELELIPDLAVQEMLDPEVTFFYFTQWRIQDFP